MSDKNNTGVPFTAADASEQQLWDALEDYPQASPSAHLRRSFFQELDRTSSLRWHDRLRNFLGFSGNLGWLTATVCLALGLTVGQLQDRVPAGDSQSLAALQQQVTILNRSLILDRLENASASKRLRGVFDASSIAEYDVEVARALLTRATEDSVSSVRSAAIDALGPQLREPEVGGELMASLEAAESPLVQLALVDLVLRHGSTAQLQRLIQLADLGRLHEDLVQYVESSVQGEKI